MKKYIAEFNTMVRNDYHNVWPRKGVNFTFRFSNLEMVKRLASNFVAMGSGLPYMRDVVIYKGDTIVSGVLEAYSQINTTKLRDASHWVERRNRKKSRKFSKAA